MGQAHASHSLVQIQTRVTDIAIPELVHNVVIHFVCIYKLTVCVERRYTICQAFLDKVIAQVQVKVFPDSGSIIDRTLPVWLGQHFKHHQMILVQSALVYLHADIVRDWIWNHTDTRIADVFFINRNNDTVRRNDVHLRILATHPIFKNILQLIWVVT